MFFTLDDGFQIEIGATLTGDFVDPNDNVCDTPIDGTLLPRLEPIFADNFESGDTSMWTRTQP